MNESTRRDVASRVRGLIAGQDLEETAQRLRVDEVSLRMSTDEASPYPTLDVLIAVIASYGVDPNWLLTGQYDAGTHRQVLEANRHAVGQILARLANDMSAKPLVANPVDEPERLRIA